MKEQARFITIRVQPRAARAGLERLPEGIFLVRVHAPASEGAANRECEAMLAKALKVPKSAVQIVRGEKSRFKQIAVTGLTAAEIDARLTQFIQGKAA